MVKLGTFAMPLHPPHRPVGDIIKENQDKIILADQLGFDIAIWANIIHARRSRSPRR